MGVMALDMEDRIESWNAQMEVMYATAALADPDATGAERLPGGVCRGVLPGAAKCRHQQPV